MDADNGCIWEKREDSLGGLFSCMLFGLWQVLRHPESEDGRGEQSPLALGACSAPKKMVLPGKRGVPVCQGIGFLAKNLGGSCLINIVCPVEEVGGSANNSFCCSTPKGFASL